MIKAKIIMPASLYKKAFWKAHKFRLILKSTSDAGLLTFMTILLFATYGYFEKGKFNDFDIRFTLIVWTVLSVANLLRLYINYFKAYKGSNHSFDAVVSEQGVDIGNEIIPWEYYQHYIDYDDYIELHHQDKGISFLPKTDELKEVIQFTQLKVKKKN